MPVFRIIPRTYKEEATILPREQIFLAQDGVMQQLPSSSVGDHHAPDTRSSNTYISRTPIERYFQKPTQRKVNQNSHTFRVKNVHSNEWANLEILAAKYAGLTGIAVPWTVFNVGAEHDNPALAEASKKRKDLHTKPIGKPFYFIASMRLKGYQDLSTFIDYIYKNQLDFFFPEGNEENEQKRNLYIENYNELTRLRKLPEAHHAENKIKKRDCMVACFKLLPQELKDMIDELFVTSAWLGNWDMFNWDLTNMGFTVIHKEDNSVEIQPAIIDFGNCFFAGFGGKHKQYSFESANEPAKLEKNSPKDFDPHLPDNKKIALSAAIFNAIPGLALGTIPRRLPFETLFIENDKKVVECINNKREQNGELSKGFMRGLYRISLISDASIEQVAKDWFHIGKEINYTSSRPENHYSSTDLINLIKQRRDYICKTFAPEISKYQETYKADALETLHEARTATFDITKENIRTNLQSVNDNLKKDISSAISTTDRNIKTYPNFVSTIQETTSAAKSL